jgi:para-aminobenzoate synthetase
MRTLLIDNYDSFTYNLYQWLTRVNGHAPLVIKNNEMSWSEIKNLTIDNIVISPGPGHPAIAKDIGVCADVFRHADIPVLGICLGHQCLAHVYGSKVTHAPKPMHGRRSKIFHNHSELFTTIPASFNVVRYHSYHVERPLAHCLEVLAHSDDDVIMAIKHREKPYYGVQFHPESIHSEYGIELLKNFKQITADFYHAKPLEFRYEELPAPKTLKSENLFQNCFGESNPVIWLDSHHPEFSSLSIMGDMSGPHSHRLRYEISSGKTEYLSESTQYCYEQSIFDVLKHKLNYYKQKSQIPNCPFQLGYVGYFGYELKNLTNPVNNKHKANTPDAEWLFLDRAIVIDHKNEKMYLMALFNSKTAQITRVWFNLMKKKIESANSILAKPEFKPTNLNTPIKKQHFAQSKLDYVTKIHQCLAAIRDGESYELCLTQQWHAELQNNTKIKTKQSLDYYLSLRKISRAPYGAYCRFDQTHIASASIERFISVNSDRIIESKPIKGTLKRGKTKTEDSALIQQLKETERFQAENLMIVDLLRNDLNKVCELDTVHVPYFQEVESFSQVHQLVSTIRGCLRAELSVIDAIVACFPGGSMTGAPKIRSLEILDDIETEARGIYSGSLGYLSLCGCADLNIVIRTAIFHENQVSIGVGGAITALSNPAEEYDEICLKWQPLGRLFELIEEITAEMPANNLPD